MSVEYVKFQEFDAGGNDINQLWQGLRGIGVLSGCVVSPLSGTTVQVSSGTVYFQGISVPVGPATISLTPDPNYSVKAIVCVNQSGSVSVLYGTPETANPPNAIGRYCFRPLPPPVPDDAVVLAEIFMNPSDSTITSEKIRDRRVFVTKTGGGGAIVDYLLRSPWSFYSTLSTTVSFIIPYTDTVQKQPCIMASPLGVDYSTVIITHILPSNFESWNSTGCIKVYVRPVNAANLATVYVYDSNLSLAGAKGVSGGGARTIVFNSTDLSGTFNPSGSLQLNLVGYHPGAGIGYGVLWGFIVLSMKLGA